MQNLVITVPTPYSVSWQIPKVHHVHWRVFIGKLSSFCDGGDRERGMVDLWYLRLDFGGLGKELSELEMTEASAPRELEREAIGWSIEVEEGSRS